MKKTIKLRKLRLGESQVRVISTHDLREIVGGTNSGGGSDPKDLVLPERGGGESS